MNKLLLAEVFNGPWSIDKQYAQGLVMSALATLKSGSDSQSSKLAEPFAVDSTGEKIKGDDVPPGSVGVVTIDGPIVQHSDRWYGIKGTIDAARELRDFDQDSNIVGNILVLNSGGGAVYAIKPITDAIDELEKPLVIFTSEYLASAAYRIAAHGQHIIAYHPQGIIGSIGTMSAFSDFQPMFEKWGAKFHEIYATLSTLKNKTFNDALEGKYDSMRKKMLDPMNEQFIADIKRLRGSKLSESEKGIFQGETYLASDAIGLGLIDQLGTMSNAYEKVMELAEASPSSQSSQSQKNADMKFQKVHALAGKKDPSQEELDLANAELTEAGITEVTLVAESVLNNASQATKDLETANAALTTAKSRVSELEKENGSLKEKLAAAPAAVALAVGKGDPATELTAEEQAEKEIADLPHNKSIAGNPLFN